MEETLMYWMSTVRHLTSAMKSLYCIKVQYNSYISTPSGKLLR